MPKLDSIEIRGRSGQEYAFRVYIWGHQFKPLPAVYVVTERRLEPDGSVLYFPVYAGQTADLSQIFENHPHEECFQLYLANTIAVLAEGLARSRPRAVLEGTGESTVAILSEFAPNAAWSARRAMARNATIAGLAEVVVVVAAGRSGGAWSEGELCLTTGRRLLVPEFSEDLAPGNHELIRRGAEPLPIDDPEAAADLLVGPSTSTSSGQLGLFG